MTAVIVNPINHSDIARFNEIIDREGKVGVDKVYSEMIIRGYGSAYWAKNEYDLSSSYGLANVSQLEKQQFSRKLKNKHELDNLEILTAKETLTQLSKLVKKSEDGFLNEDIHYKDYNEIRKNVYQKANLNSKTESLLTSNFNIQKSVNGEDKANENFDKLMNPEGKVIDRNEILKIAKEKDKIAQELNIGATSIEDTVVEGQIIKKLELDENLKNEVENIIDLSREMAVKNPTDNKGFMAKSLSEALKNQKEANKLTIEDIENNNLTEFQKKVIGYYNGSHLNSLAQKNLANHFKHLTFDQMINFIKNEANKQVEAFNQTSQENKEKREKYGDDAIDSANLINESNNSKFSRFIEQMNHMPLFQTVVTGIEIGLGGISAFGLYRYKKYASLLLGAGVESLNNLLSSGTNTEIAIKGTKHGLNIWASLITIGVALQTIKDEILPEESEGDFKNIMDPLLDKIRNLSLLHGFKFISKKFKLNEDSLNNNDMANFIDIFKSLSEDETANAMKFLNKFLSKMSNYDVDYISKMIIKFLNLKPIPMFMLINLAPFFDDAEHLGCPIIIDLDGNGVKTTKLAQGIKKAIYFDLDGNGFAEKTAWVDKNDGLLVLDKNKNGKIDNGHELFGNHTLNINGEKTFKDGYEALAIYDENGDGKINAKDSIYHELKIWQDKNENGISEEDELISLIDAGIIEIDLNATKLNQRDENGNLITRRGNVTLNDGTQRVAEDIWFQINTAHSKYLGEIEISDEIKALPNIKGFGNVHDLHIAMQKDAVLKEMVENYLNTENNRAELLNDLIYRWTNSNHIVSNSRGEHIDARTMVSLENLVGRKYNGTNGADPHRRSAPVLIKEFNKFVQYVESHLEITRTENFHLALYLLQALNDKQNDWSLFAEHLQELQKSGNLEEAKYSYRLVSGLMNYSEQKLSLDNYLFNDSLNHISLFKSGLIQNTLFADLKANNFIHGTKNNEMLIGSELNDEIQGGNGSDTIIGNEGSDRLIGGNGTDKYIFSRGHGTDRLFDGKLDPETPDILIFLGAFSTTSLFSRQNDDLVIHAYQNEEDFVSIYNYFSDSSRTHLIFQFEDKTLTVEDVKQMNFVVHGTDNKDSLRGWFSHDEIHGQDGDDSISLSGGNDKAYGGKGKDYINGQDGEDEIYGEDDDDSLYGGAGSDHIDGGAGNDNLHGDNGKDILIGGAGKDYLDGGNGADQYIFSRGHGKDKVHQHSSALENQDTLIFLEALSTTTLFSRNGKDLVINAYQNEEDMVIIPEYFTDSTKTNLLFQFDDKTLSVEDLKEMTFTLIGTDDKDTLTGWVSNNRIYGQDGDDNIRSQFKSDYIDAGAGNDSVSAGDGDDYVEGKEGNDHLNGDNGKDILIGGTGEDYLNGGNGADQYIFSRGHGKDKVHQHSSALENQDTLIFLEALSTTTLFSRNGKDLVINAYQNEEDMVIIPEYFSDSTKTNLFFQFDDKALSVEDLKEMTFTLNGTDNNDYLNGWWLSKNIINGGDGADDLRGHDKEDELNGGAGKDNLSGGGGIDTLNGEDGDDNINGGAGKDIIIGGTGKDYLSGGGYEADTYIFSRGHGQDIVHEYSFAPEHRDTLIFSEALSTTTLFTRKGNDLVINAYQNEEDFVIIYDYFYQMPRTNLIFQFEDKSLTIEDLKEMTFTLNGTDNNDYLNGWWLSKNIINGGDGADDLRGHDKEDELNGGKGKDRLTGGKGKDIFVLDNHGDGDEITDFNLNEDTIGLLKSMFPQLSEGVNSENFHLGESTQNENQHLIFNPQSQQLFYDPDGVLPENPIYLAKISGISLNGLLTDQNFEII